MNYLKNTKGFTLIELIVVIAIIATLSTFVVAQMADSRQKAKNIETIRQVREYQTALGIFISNEGNLPQTGDTDLHCIGASGNNCIWASSNVSTESSGDLADIGNYIADLIFVNSPLVSGDAGSFKGLLYECTTSACSDANFYWTEYGVTSCTKGTTHYTLDDGIVCKEAATGGLAN